MAEVKSDHSNVGGDWMRMSMPAAAHLATGSDWKRIPFIDIIDDL